MKISITSLCMATMLALGTTAAYAVEFTDA